MLRRVFILLFLLVFPKLVFAQGCSNPDRVLTASVNTSSATTTRLINNTSSDASIIVCGFTLTLDGGASAQQVIFEYGTGSTCGTGTIVLSGGLKSPGAANSVSVIVSHLIPLGKLPAGTHLCIITAQANTVTGVLTYILQ